jgi:hypothetical protein
MVGVRGREGVGVEVAVGGGGVSEGGRGEGVMLGATVGLGDIGTGLQELSRKSNRIKVERRCMVTPRFEHGWSREKIPTKISGEE